MALIFWWAIPIVVFSIIGVLVSAHFIKRHRKKPRKDNQSFVKIAGSEIYTRLPSFKKVIKTYKIILAIAALLLSVMLSTSTLMFARFASTGIFEPEDYNRDIMLCLDTSGSMSEDDAKISGTFAKLVDGFKGERIGLAVWDSSTVTVFPLTNDYDFVKSELAKAEKAFDNLSNYNFDTDDGVDWTYVYSGTGEGNGSSLIGDGLGSCLGNFDNTDAKRSRSVILATDNYVAGEQLITLPEAAQIAKDKNIRVYGLNPADYSNDLYVDEVAKEYKDAVLLTGGTYYKYDNPSAISGIITEVNRQDATRFKGAPQLIKTDQPLVLGIIFLVSMVGFMIIVWRLRI
jgi:hypothetical protein